MHRILLNLLLRLVAAATRQNLRATNDKLRIAQWANRPRR